ncbi:ENTH-domain-containing protein [Polychaeton citri CBS 116435]|uniref:ENTH-domain-containing protein n=1 Tax=Polychaeton citri CBS 116435 TaxID=1314669 RepID=A0A9P4Q269_9PEZI|nr:ENTH-domain-containing protein [Polychaeton citri CBS 116435]
MSSVMRSVKNVTKGYSSVQVKVRNATSNDPWGPTGTDMADIARITYNSSTDFYEVMDMLDKRLNDKGKNWRHVLKSLKVLDYCLHEGSELVVTWSRKNIYIIKTLREFIYQDEDGKDVGASIRHSAKELTSLILDEERLRAERANRGSWKSRVTGLEDIQGNAGTDHPPRPPRERRQRQEGEDDNDLEYRLALEASKNEAEADAARRAKSTGAVDTDDDLAKAIKLSKEEEELRKRELEDQNQASLLFDDLPAQQPQATGFNQGYQQQQAVDWSGNPVQQQQSQQTGYLNNAYSQPTGIQPQQTAFQNGGYGGGFGYQQPQRTGYEQMQQPHQQFIQPQNTYNPYAQFMGGMGAQQQPQQQPESVAQSGSNNPWASTNQQSPITAQPTGSNNPFAANRPQSAGPVFKAPTLSTLQEQQTAQQFNNRPNPIQSYASPIQQQQTSIPSPVQQNKPQDPYSSHLNALLSSGEGQDTFGNVGNLRIPAQHTAPGTFINSAGAGSMGRLEAAKTGNNPFYSQQQTGMQQQQQQQFGAAPQQFPAATGPVGGGFGGNNPFGQRPQQQPGQSGSLIDF